jgi:hypothetical protein
VSTKKLAIFVEGQTEQIFLKTLIEEIAGKKKIHVEAATYRTATLAKLQLTKKRMFRSDLEYFVLLMNCQNDERVKSVVLEQRTSLERSGYSLILGLRDLYPRALSDIAAVKRNIAYRLPTAGIPTHILLAVAEVEAWFLQDYTHYARIDPALDPGTFKGKFGFDPLIDSAEVVPWPSNLLHRIYQSVGKAYRKSRNHVERTVQVLDYAEMYVRFPSRLPHLGELIGHVDAFLT